MSIVKINEGNISNINITHISPEYGREYLPGAANS